MDDLGAPPSAALADPVEGSVNDVVPRLTDREKEVLDAAARVFARRGYANATVEQVAAELGILKGSIYYYVKTKDDLLFGVVQQLMERSEAVYAEVAAEPDLDPLERFALCLRRAVRLMADNLAAISVYHHDANLLEGSRREWLDTSRHRQYSFIASLIENAQAAGLADRKRDPYVLARLALGMISSLVTWVDPEKADEMGETVADLVILGIIGEDPGSDG